MSYSINNLIEIYETALSDLLHYPGDNQPEKKLSKISIPKIGDTLQFSNSKYKIEAVERFCDVLRPESLDDFLNAEDLKIIHELEAEGNILIDDSDEGEYEDDPYSDFDTNTGSEWEIGGENDNIELIGPDSYFEDEKGVVEWKNEDKNDLRETTIAYYRSFHSSGRAFGIYYKRNGLKLKTKAIYKFCMQRGYIISIPEAYIIVKTMTQFHEIYHHKIEAIASRIEVISRMPIYKNGFTTWYQRTRNRANCFEETFANCYAYQKTKATLSPFLPSVALHNIMVFWFNMQPLPYRNALKIIKKPFEIQRILENQFFEIILSKFFAGDSRFGKSNSKVWSLFTHGTQPYITVNSNVYYII